jgi:site-specific DNA-methyltransferase (adenine-specific)
MDANSVDMVFTDLPYLTTNAKWDCPIDLDGWWEQVKRIRKPGAAIIHFSQVPFNITLGASNLKELRYEWIYSKPNASGHLNAKKMPMKAHENIMVFYDKLPTYNPQKTQGHPRKVSTAEHKRNCKGSELYNPDTKLCSYDSTERYPRDIIKFSSDKQKKNLFSTQKPVALCEYIIKTYSNEGDTILDTCMGSGSIIEAGDNLGRKMIGMEKDPDNFQIAFNRLKDRIIR